MIADKKTKSNQLLVAADWIRKLGIQVCRLTHEAYHLMVPQFCYTMIGILLMFSKHCYSGTYLSSKRPELF